MKVLCIDDSLTIHMIVKSALGIIDVEVEGAKLPSIARKMLEEMTEPYDLILLDWNMPEMNGLELLKIIKANPEWESIPVMMLTSEGNKTSMTEAIEAGAIDYVVKPFSQEDFIAKVMATTGQNLF